jgi:CBS domain-containing protein
VIATAKSILDLTAADLMSRDVVMIPRAMSLRTAAHLLSRAHVSGAPVVDSDGVCVGVLSATDFMRWVGDEETDHTRPVSCDPDCFFSAWQVTDVEALPADDVGCHMTADPVMVSPRMTIAELAGAMIDAHIHRIVVVDEMNRPIGVVSSTDILAAVANADLHRKSKGRWTSQPPRQKE